MKDESQRASGLPSGNDLRLPWHLHLPRPLERDFAEYFRNHAANVAPWAAAMVISLILLTVAVEYRFSPETTVTSWRPRLLCIMLATASVLVAQHPAWHRWLHVTSLAVVFAVALTGSWLALNLDSPAAYGFFLQTPLAILLACVALRVPFYLATISSITLIGMLALTLLYSDGIDPGLTLLLLTFSIASGAISLFGQYIYERLLRQHFLSENVLFQHRDELHSANRILESQATVDGLTGCLNRRGMQSQLDQVLHGFGGTDVSERVTLVLFDIDFFKQYNDTYGHLAGDECLKTVASIPRSMTQGDQDFVARYGGEEFIVVLVNTTLRDALVFAERMRTRIEQLGLPHTGSRVSQVVTISVGVASTSHSHHDATNLIKCADEALYQAKGAGRNRVAYMSNQGRVAHL